MTMTLIERINVTNSGGVGYTFSNIPQTYTDLLLITCIMGTGTNIDGPFVQINGITTASYTFNMLRRNNASSGINDGGYTSATTYTAPTLFSAGQTTYPNFAGNGLCYFPNYTNTSINRGWNAFSGVSSNSSTVNAQTIITGGTNPTTAAITSILVSGYGLAMYTGSTLSLYGIS
jgi:hypothetical protein